eukprot:TRINITY_DN6109_c0_g1_i4.p1 TRINITY_DN6109_c0_g1~~TRINITY_DN6109_c0_g1_i4.p1  ORF type:complete len:357 (+),score=100.47 TRINITY_DN6109_c0_g1_i4:53-1123(+)
MDAVKPEDVSPVAHYRVLPCGLRVSPICLGAMSFGDKWAEFMGEASEEQCREVFDAYVDAGGNFIDTANKYHEGQSEEWLGKWIEERGNRESIVLATKYTLPMVKGQVNHGGNHRKNLVQAVEASLKRLRTTYIDILYVHMWDATTPPRELMSALNVLVEQGKVLHLAISDTAAWIVAQCNGIADQYGWAKFMMYQGKHHFGERDMERDIIPMCKALGLAVVPWNVLGRGVWAGKFETEEDVAKAHEHDGRKGVTAGEKEWKIIKVLKEVAQELNAKPGQVTIAWSHAKGCIPLIGARKKHHIVEAIEGSGLKLSKEQVARLDEITDFDIGFPHNFIGQEIGDVDLKLNAGVLVPM